MCRPSMSVVIRLPQVGSSIYSSITNRVAVLSYILTFYFCTSSFLEDNKVNCHCKMSRVIGCKQFAIRCLCLHSMVLFMWVDLCLLADLPRDKQLDLIIFRQDYLKLLYLPSPTVWLNTCSINIWKWALCLAC